MLELLQDLVQPHHVALAAGGSILAIGAYAALPGPSMKNGWLTAHGAKRHGLIGGTIPLGTMGRIFKDTITAPKESFILAIGPTGYGKTKNLIENIIFADTNNSQFIFDLKGDLLKATAHARSKVGPVYVLDPSGGPTNRYNPYVDIPVGDIASIKDFHSWIVPQGGHQYYTPVAVELFGAAAMHILHCEGHKKTMPAMYSFLSSDNWIDVLKKSPIEESAAFANGIDTNTASAIKGSVVSLLGWLGYPAIRTIMGQSDFRLTDVQSAEEPFTIYIRLPEQSRRTMMPFARAIIGMLTMTLMKSEELAADGKSKQRGVTMVIDEVKQLALPNIGTFLSAGRSFGGRVVMASQLISEVRELYGKVIEGNCTTQLFTRTQDIDEATHISKMLPKRVVQKRSVTHSSSSHGSGRSVRVDEIEEPIMTPTDVMKLPKHRCLVGVVDGHPVKLDTIYAPKAFADIRGKPFEVTQHEALSNQWDEVQMRCVTPKKEFKPKANNVKVAK